MHPLRQAQWAVMRPQAPTGNYGRDRSFQAILSGKVRAPKSTMGFMKAIAETDHAATIAEAKPDKE
jgi:hypothetical protein